MKKRFLAEEVVVVVKKKKPTAKEAKEGRILKRPSFHKIYFLKEVPQSIYCFESCTYSWSCDGFYSTLTPEGYDLADLGV